MHPAAGGAWAVVVAGGRGLRFGARKQFELLGGRPVTAWSIDAAAAACDGVVLVVPEGSHDEEVCRHPQVDAVVVGGPTRSASVRAGLAAVPLGVAVIAVHDAARPLSLPEVWSRVLDAVRDGADGAIPVVAVTDTVVRATSDGRLQPVDRMALRSVQTPQAFRADLLRSAHEDGTDATDDASLVARLGGRIVGVAGHPANLKVTGPGDLIVAEALLAGSGAP